MRRKVILYKENSLDQLDAGFHIAYPKDENGKNYRYYTVPSFLIIGAAKSSTSELSTWLGTHPQLIQASSLEIHFFDSVIDINKEWVRYLINPHFSISDQENVYSNNIHFFEKTTTYFCAENRGISCANLIKKMMPSGKFIVILRNPTERLYSHYQMTKRGMQKNPKNYSPMDLDSIFSKSFFSFIKEKPPFRRRKLWETGHYAQHLANWLNYFKRDQLLVLTAEEFKGHPFAVMKKVSDFLGITDFDYKPLAEQTDKGLWVIKNKVSKAYKKSYEPMDENARCLLDEYYASWNKRLRQLFPNVSFPW